MNYAWVWTSDRRYDHFGVVEEMCLNDNFPTHMIFHHQGLFANEKFTSDDRIKLSANAKKAREMYAEASKKVDFPKGLIAKSYLN